MISWGINSLNHGSSLAVFSHGNLSSWKVCPENVLPREVVTQALHHGAPDRIFWYERPWVKKTRQVYAGQYDTAMDLSVLPRKFIKDNGLSWCGVTYTPHHASHAAAGYYTSRFDHAAVVVLDAIGEWECATIWEARQGRLKKIWSRSYPNSLGLFYSAFTKLVGLEPIKQESIFQSMSDQGDPGRYYREILNYMYGELKAGKNMHRGVLDWPHEIKNLQDQCDIAAAVQEVFQRQVSQIMDIAKRETGSESLVYMGGCAMNSKANKAVVEPKWKYIWSLPMPGDPSSAIGAVLYHSKERIWNYRWDHVKHIDIKI